VIVFEDFAARLKGRQGSDDDFTAFCPSHADREHRSLHVTRRGDGGVLFHCFVGCTWQEITTALGLNGTTTGSNGSRGHRLTLEEFSAAKGLPLEFLVACGVKQEAWGLRITYLDRDGRPARQQRRRTALKAKEGSLWEKGAGSPIPYGRWRLDEAIEKGELTLVEGETNTQTGWLHNVPTLGIPGADMVKVLEADDLRGIERLYILQDPDRGGETFVAGLDARLTSIRWHGAAYVVTLPVKDLNELHLQAGSSFAGELLAAKAAARKLTSRPSDNDGDIADERAERAISGVWPAPAPVPDDLPVVPTFDAEELLPSAFAPWVADIAERAQCPTDFVAVAAVVGASAVLGRRLTLRPKRHDDWAVVPNLWGLVIGRPGIMKSPALHEALRPLGRVIADAREAHTAAMAEHDFRQAEAQLKREAVKTQLKDAMKRGAPTDELRAAFEATAYDAPTERRYVVNDSTVEKLGALLNENRNGLLLFRDELAGFLRTMEREGHENDRAFYCEAWNGTGSYTYDRIGRGTLHIEAACMSLLGGIQPGPLAAYLREAFGDGGDDGLIQRFQLMVYPDVAPEWRNVDRWPDTDARRRVVELFRSLDRLAPSDVAAHDGALPEERPFLRFTPEAQERFDSWRTTHERIVRSCDEHPVVISHLAKYRSLLPSLALLFHVVSAVDRGTGGPVTIEATERAIAWCAYLEAHARRVYESVTAGPRVAARVLAGKLRAGKLTSPFASREILRAQWSGLTARDEIAGALGLLESLHWVRPEHVPATTRGGRSTTRYHINPAAGAK
jgi:hypothetical protein